MKLRCKEGDVALVVFDTIECASNIGRLVTVSGPLRDDWGLGPTWLIEPMTADAWAVEKGSTGEIRFDTPPLTNVEHPDQWLLPLRLPPDQEVESDSRVSEMTVE